MQQTFSYVTYMIFFLKIKFHFVSLEKKKKLLIQWTKGFYWHNYIYTVHEVRLLIGSVASFAIVNSILVLTTRNLICTTRKNDWSCSVYFVNVNNFVNSSLQFTFTLYADDTTLPYSTNNLSDQFPFFNSDLLKFFYWLHDDHLKL